ncbi:MAG: pentapeptide repeat-containing protein [Alphaproteobacteria bacterium]|nr:pentapeptide repeat-containing protein [Alphaproteobacteria bacterium]
MSLFDKLKKDGKSSEKNSGVIVLRNSEGKPLFATKAENVVEALEKAARDGVELKGLCLENLKIKGEKDKPVNLNNLKAPYAKIYNVKFEHVSMENANFFDSEFNKSTISKCNLKNASMDNISVKLNMSPITGTNFTIKESDLTDASFRGYISHLKISNCTINKEEAVFLRNRGFVKIKNCNEVASKEEDALVKLAMLKGVNSSR